MAQLATSNISTTLVANTLGTSTRDVGSLCTNSNINKWSKYKPTRYSSLAPTMDQFWKANDGYCGFDLSNARIISAGDTDGMINNTWEYLPPRGGEDEPYRLGDFRGYCHDALVQYTCNPPEQFQIQAESIITFTENQAEGNLKFVDLLTRWNAGSQGNTNICVMIKQNSNVQYASVDISQGGNQLITINLGLNFVAGSADMYLFLSDRPCTDNEFPSNTTFWCYPDGEDIQRHFTIQIGQAHTNYDDAFEIYEWNVTEYYNYISFTFTVRMTPSYEGSMTIMSFNRQNIRMSCNIRSSEGIVINKNDTSEGSNTFIISSFDLSSANGTATVSGNIYLDEFTISQNYDGYIYFELDNSSSIDVLGLYEVEFIYQ